MNRKLAKDLGLKCGPGQYDYHFGRVIEVMGVGHFTFADLMSPKWRGYRCDVFVPEYHKCKVFGVKRSQVRVVK